MKILADENLFEPIIEFLKSQGYEVISVRDSKLRGTTDDRIYKFAVDNKLFIITMDKDFSRMLRFPPENCGGILLLKLYRMTVDDTTNCFIRCFNQLKENKIEKRLTIMNRHGISYRSLTDK